MSKRVLYVPGSRWLQSVEAFSDSPQSWEESIKDLPGEIMDFESALEAIAEADGIAYNANKANPVTVEVWDEMLNILPPSRWVNYGPSESFRISEALTGSLSTFYVRIGDNHWRVNAPHGTGHWELVRICEG